MGQSDRPRDVWKKPAANGPPGRTGPRRGAGRWIAAALVVVALGGTIAGLLVYLWPDPPPVVLAIPVSNFEHPDWPPDPWAEADARGFLERAGGEAAQTFQAQEKAAIVRELNRVADDSRGRPVVVFLTALGMSDGGKVFLIPSLARPDDPATWLALDDVLSPLRRATAPRLLVLDVRPVTDPRAVLTGEDVNESLDAALEKLDKAGDLPFFVLTANNPTDGANALRALRRSAFGLALALATGGEADGWNAERKRDGRVSVRELAAHVRELTNHASTAAWLPAQLPRLHGSAADFDAFHVPRGGPAALPALADAESYPEFLRDAWKDRDKWLDDRLQLRAPRVVRHFSLTAVRAERRWLAGGELAGIKAAFDSPASRLRDAAGSLKPLVQPVGSVARARRKPGVDPVAARAVLQPVFSRIIEAPGPERDKALLPAMAAVWDKPPDPEPFDAAAVAIFAFAQSQLEKPTAEQMKQLAALAAGFKPRPPRHAELVTISLIGNLPVEQTDKWPPQTVRVLLDVAAVAELAAAGEGANLPWIKKPLADADAIRRNAVRDLCDAKTEKVRVAAVAALEAVKRDYAVVRAAGDALTKARHEFEEARAVLADVAAAFPFDSPLMPEVAALRWADLAEDFIRIRTMLAPPTEPRPLEALTGELDRTADSLGANRRQLLSLLRVPESGTVRQLESLLRWPGWSLDERTRLLAKLTEADRTAARKVLDGWLKEPPGREAAAPPKGAARGPADAVKVLGRWVTLLKLADAASAATLAAELAALGDDPPAPATAALARKVRLAVRRELAEAYTKADEARQAETGWAVDTDDVSAFSQPGTPGPPNPELPARRAAEAEFHRWLARARYAEDAKVLGASPAKAAQDAAAAYREIDRAYADAFR